MDYLKAFLVGGALCLVGQILIDKTKLSPARILVGYVVCGVLLGAVGVLILGRFGAGLVGRIERPFFQMVSGLGLEGAFQRLEQLASALWALGDLALLGFLLLCLSRLASHASGRPEKPGWIWVLAAGICLLALPVTFWQGVLEGPILWAGNLIAGGMILVIFGRKKKK